MEKTEHILLTGEGAETFATNYPEKVEIVSAEYFYDERRWGSYLAAKGAAGSELDHSSAFAFKTSHRGEDSKGDIQGQGKEGVHEVEQKVEEKGTVGCVALDVHGNLAGKFPSLTQSYSCVCVTNNNTQLQLQQEG